MALNTRQEQKFISLLISHQPILRSYLMSQVPSRQDQQDLLQEVNMVLWEKKADFQLGTNFGAWACTLAYYQVLDYRKKTKRNSFLIFKEDLSLALTTESQNRKSETLEAKKNALQICLKKMSAKNRRLLLSRYSASKGEMGQFSEESGRSLASLRVTLCRLRSKLRSCVEGVLVVKGGQCE